MTIAFTSLVFATSTANFPVSYSVQEEGMNLSSLNIFGTKVILFKEFLFSSTRFCIPCQTIVLISLTAPTITPNSDNRFFVPSQSLEDWFCILSCVYLYNDRFVRVEKEVKTNFQRIIINRTDLPESEPGSTLFRSRLPCKVVH
jgi:hypothetical protein